MMLVFSLFGRGKKIQGSNLKKEKDFYFFMVFPSKYSPHFCNNKEGCRSYFDSKMTESLTEV